MRRSGAGCNSSTGCFSKKFINIYVILLANLQFLKSESNYVNGTTHNLKMKIVSTSNTSCVSGIPHTLENGQGTITDTKLSVM
jgi:hypothetical protein